jgi:hypothetical protein
MNDAMDPTLLSVAEAVADWMPVDWDGLRHREPSLATRLEWLRGVAEVAKAHRELRDAQAGNSTSQVPPSNG